MAGLVSAQVLSGLSADLLIDRNAEQRGKKGIQDAIFLVPGAMPDFRHRDG
jgi:hypothetical protein